MSSITLQPRLLSKPFVFLLLLLGSTSLLNGGYSTTTATVAFVPPLYKNEGFTVTKHLNDGINFDIPNDDNDATFIEFVSFDDVDFMVRLIIKAEKGLLLSAYFYTSQFDNPNHLFCLKITNKDMFLYEIASFKIVEFVHIKGKRKRILTASSTNKVYWRRTERCTNKTAATSSKFIPKNTEPITTTTASLLNSFDGFIITENLKQLYLHIPNDNETITFIEFVSFDDVAFMVRLIIEAEDGLLLSVYFYTSRFDNPNHLFCLKITDKDMFIDNIASFKIVESVDVKRKRRRFLSASSTNKVHWRRTERCTTIATSSSMLSHSPPLLLYLGLLFIG